MTIFILEKDKFHVKTGQLSCLKMYQTHATSTHVFMHQLPLGGTIWSVSHWLPSSFWDSSGTQFEKSYLAVASEQEQAEHPAVLVIVQKKKSKYLQHVWFLNPHFGIHAGSTKFVHSCAVIFIAWSMQIDQNTYGDIQVQLNCSLIESNPTIIVHLWYMIGLQFFFLVLFDLHYICNLCLSFMNEKVN